MDLISGLKSSNLSFIEENYIITGNFKNVDFSLMNWNIINSENYLEMLQDDGSTRICSNLIKLIKKEYDKFSPVIKMKIKNEENMFNSKSTNESTKGKNSAFKEMKKFQC